MDDYGHTTAESYTPEDIARAVFSERAKDPGVLKMISEDDDMDASKIHEICLTILLEGFDVINNGLRNADLRNIDVETFRSMNPWFYSLGFKIVVLSYPENDETYKELYEKYYCKAVIRNELNESLFIFKNIDKPYHFFLNGTYLSENRQKDQLNELYSIFIHNNQVFTISFDFYDLS